MKKEDCFHYGKIIKTHGFKGELTVSVLIDIPGILEKTESVFIEIEGLLVPFFIESYNYSGNNSFTIKFEGIDNDDKSRRLCQSNIWLANELLPEKIKKQRELFDFAGFKIIDKIKGEIGILLNIIEMPQQQLLQIDYHGKEILIPVAEEFICKIDKKNKTIYINAPEGLIEMNFETKK